MFSDRILARTEAAASAARKHEVRCGVHVPADCRLCWQHSDHNRIHGAHLLSCSFAYTSIYYINKPHPQIMCNGRGWHKNVCSVLKVALHCCSPCFQASHPACSQPISITPSVLDDCAGGELCAVTAASHALGAHGRGAIWQQLHPDCHGLRPRRPICQPAV